MKVREYTLNQLQTFASELAAGLREGDVVCLQGDLGAGKTTFAGAIIKALIPDIREITSPTFNLVHVYDAEKYQVWHFDLYRLNASREIENLGLDDALRYGISIIEWPEIARDMLPKDVIEIKIGFTNDPNTRIIHTSRI